MQATRKWYRVAAVLAAGALVGCGGSDSQQLAAGPDARAASAASRPAKLKPVVLTGTDYSFADRIAIAGELIAVGAPMEVPPAVHLYARHGNGWPRVAVVRGEAARTGFGAALALTGTVLVVGEPGAEGGGRARVYERAGGAWILAAALAPADPTTRGFGTAVALAGGTALVGHSSGPLGGAVEVFEQAAGWARTAILTPQERAPGDFFGQTLAAAGDTLVVGAPGSSSAVVFRRTPAGWIEEARFVEPDTVEIGYFAHHVAASPDVVIVNCECPDGEAYLFERRDGTWVLAATLYAPGGGIYQEMGHEVAISATGGAAMVSAVAAPAAGVEHAGAVYVYVRGPTGWTVERELASLHPEPEGNFGWAMAATDEALVVGAIATMGGRGEVVVFPRALR